jgi:hypothetical protein
MGMIRMSAHDPDSRAHPRPPSRHPRSVVGSGETLAVTITEGRHAGRTGMLIGPIQREDALFAAEVEVDGETVYAEFDSLVFPELDWARGPLTAGTHRR